MKISIVKVLSVLFVMEFINATLTATFLNNFSRQMEIVLSGAIVFVSISLIRKNFTYFEGLKIEKLLVFIIALFFLKISVSSDLMRTIERVLSFLILIVGYYVVPLSFLSEKKAETEEFLPSVVKYITFSALVFSIVNNAIMLLGKFYLGYDLLGLNIGNAISGRYNGLFITPAFCSEIAIFSMVMAFIYQGIYSKGVRWLSVILLVNTIWLSQTRTAIVVLIFFMFLFLHEKIREKRVLEGVAFLLVVLVGIFIFSKYTYEELSSFSSSRLEVWALALKETMSFPNIFLGSDGLDLQVGEGDDAYFGGTHNSYVQLIYNCGYLLGGAVIVFLIKKIISFGRSKDQTTSLALFGILSFMVFSIFESHLLFIRGPISFGLWLLFLIGTVMERYNMVLNSTFVKD